MEYEAGNIDEVMGEPFRLPYGYMARKVEDSYRGMMAVIGLAAKSETVLYNDFSFYSPENISDDDPYCLWQYSMHFLRMFDRSSVYAVFRDGVFVAAGRDAGCSGICEFVSQGHALEIRGTEFERIENAVSMCVPKQPACSENELRRLIRSDDPADFMKLVRAQGDVHSYEKADYADKLDRIVRDAPVDLRIAIANNGQAHESTLLRLITKDPDWRVRKAAYWNYECHNGYHDFNMYRLASMDESVEVRLAMLLLFAFKDRRIAELFARDKEDIVRCAAAFNYLGDDEKAFRAFADAGRKPRMYMMKRVEMMPVSALSYLLDTSDDPDERASIMVAMLERDRI